MSRCNQPLSLFRRMLANMFLVCAVGCSEKSPEPGYTPGTESVSNYSTFGYSDDEIVFLDNAKSQPAPEIALYDMTFTTQEGASTAVKDFGSGKSVVLVVTRGNTNPICPYCSTQTAEYIRDYTEFQTRNAEVVLVYPVETSQDEGKLAAFLTNARERLSDPSQEVPFPVVFDVELSAVDRLGLRKDLSKPATYILDGEGRVVYAYVGAHWGDRPSTKAVLSELAGLQPADPASLESEPISDQQSSAASGG